MADTLLKVENLVKEYDGQRILDGIDLTLAQGEVVVVVGPSGCGKSTLLRCINALEPVQDGSISLHGKDIRKGSKNITEMRQKIGMVFQSYELFPHLTVLDNITLSPVKVQKRKKDEVKAEAMELLQRVGLADKAASYPRQLSGGQKQRVAIAGILAMEPECIILDEPTAMLDPSGRREVMETIEYLNREKKMTIIYITHHMEEATRADRIVVMDHGRVVMSGKPRQVFTQVDRMKELGLDVPQATELAWRLRGRGLAVPQDIMTMEEMTEALCRLK